MFVHILKILILLVTSKNGKMFLKFVKHIFTKNILFVFIKHYFLSEKMRIKREREQRNYLLQFFSPNLMELLSWRINRYTPVTVRHHRHVVELPHNFAIIFMKKLIFVFAKFCSNKKFIFLRKFKILGENIFVAAIGSSLTKGWNIKINPLYSHSLEHF